MMKDDITFRYVLIYPEKLIVGIRGKNTKLQALTQYKYRSCERIFILLADDVISRVYYHEPLCHSNTLPEKTSELNVTGLLSPTGNLKAYLKAGPFLSSVAKSAINPSTSICIRKIHKKIQKGISASLKAFY